MPRYQYCPLCASPLDLRVLQEESEAKERLVCSRPSCGFIHYENPVPVVAVIVEHEGEVVLAHNKAWPPSWFALVTGFLEKAEHPELGARREVKEELNLDCTELTFIGLYPFERMNQLLLAYHAKAEGQIRLNEELDAYKKVAPEVLRPWPGGTGQAVKEWLASKGIFNEEIDFR